MDNEKEINSADAASELPKNGYPEKEDVSSEVIYGGAVKEEDRAEDHFPDMNIDLSDCSDEELEEIISGRITYEEYIARHNTQSPYPDENILRREDEFSPADEGAFDGYAEVSTKKSKKKIIIPVVCAIVLCVGIVVLFALIKNVEKEPVFNSDEYAFAYAKNSIMHIASYLSNSVLEGSEKSEIRFSTDRKIVAFSKVHESNRYKSDLYFCDVRNSEEISAGGVKVDGAVVGFYLTRDGGHIIYTKADEKKMDAYCYSIKNRSADKLDSGIHDFYIPEDKSDYFFYTKSNGASNTVYRYNIESKKPESVLQNVKNIKFMSDENGTFLFAEVNSEKDGLIDLYRVESEGNAQKLIPEIQSVLYDEFVPGGNLYFLRASSDDAPEEAENHSFDSVIVDDKADADAALTEPNLEDYKLGSFLGIKTYDYISFNLAKKAYDEKLERDKIRQAIKDGIEKVAVNNGQCVCFAYDLEKKTETRVCEDVSSNGIIAVNKTGTPRVVFTKFRVESQEQSEPVTIDEAVAASKAFDGSLEDYLKSLVPETVIPDGLALSVISDGKPGAEEIKDYSAETASFFFADNGNKLIALVKDEIGEKNSLSCMVINDNGIGVVNPIDSNVMEVIPAEKGYYYLRVDSGRDKGDLYYYSDTGTTGELLLSVVEQTMTCGDGNLLVSHKPNGAIPSLSLCENGTVTDIDVNVNFQQIAYYSNECIVYVRRSDTSSGDLYLYNGKISPVLIDSGVSKIFTD